MHRAQPVRLVILSALLLAPRAMAAQRIVSPGTAAPSAVAYGAHHPWTVRRTPEPPASRPAPDASPLPVRRGVGADAPRTVVVDTRGAELLVVRVPIPAAVRWDGLLTRRPAQFRIAPSRHVQVVGAGSGQVDLLRDSTLVLALRISRRAPAGRSLAGTVEFWVGTTNGLMPIEIDVPTQHRLSLAVPARSIVATRGKWSSFEFRVVNDGNVDESPRVHVAAPSGWRADVRALGDASSRMVAPGAARAMQLRVWAPATASTGSIMLPLSLSRTDSLPLVVSVPVDLLGDITGTVAGPTVTTSFVAGQSGNDATQHGYSVTLGGQLSDSTRLSGRFSYAGTGQTIGGAGFALARAGVMTAPPMLEIDHPRAQVTVGATAGAFPELGGQFLAGTGATARVSTTGARRWTLRAFELRPLALQQQFSLTARAPGRYAGGEIGLDAARARAAIFGSVLDDPMARRQLEAFGVRAGVGHALGSHVASEVAYRRHGARAGAGVMTSARWIGQRGSLDVRVMHAPGGSRAFARASDEVMATATRMVGQRSYLTLGGWAQSDENPALGAARNVGWYAMPTFSVSSAGSIGLEVRQLSFSSGVDVGRLRTDELAGGGSANFTLLGVQLTARTVLARLDRSLIMPEVPLANTRQWRLDHTLLVSRAGTRGTLSLSAIQQQYAAVGGAQPGQVALTLRADRLRPFVTHSVHVDAELQSVQVGSTGSRHWLARAALTLPLVGGTSVALGVERNPFMAASGRSPLLYSLRLDRATMLPRPFTGARGFVFRDENGNGRHDRGERGVAGVVVHCGGVRVASDRHGRYACTQRRHEVDARTVPTGLVASVSRVDVGEAIALRVVQPLHITVFVPGADSARVSAATLGKLQVTARDSVGMSWSARALEGGRYVVDALPVGRYRIVVDADQAEEPLVPVGDLPQVTVGSTGSMPDVLIGMRPRPVRLRTFGPAPVVDTPASPPASAAPAAPARARTRPRAITPRSSERP